VLRDEIKKINLKKRFKTKQTKKKGSNLIKKINKMIENLSTMAD